MSPDAGNGLYLIAGLGNPTPKYEGTRHNVGFDTVDRFAAGFQTSIDRARKNALVAEVRDRGRRIILVKPQTFMNLSGEAVAPLMRFFQVPIENVLVIFDELQLPLGRLKLLRNGSDGGHNGMKSIIEHFGTRDIARLRLGIGPKPPQWDQADFVLSRFNKEEQKIAAEMIEKGAEGIKHFIDEGPERAMNRINTNV